MNCLLPLPLTQYTHTHPHSDRASRPVFPQISSQILQKTPSELRCPSRAWKVNLVGEGADDAGGVFDETIAQMCEVSLSVCLPSVCRLSACLYHLLVCLASTTCICLKIVSEQNEKICALKNCPSYLLCECLFLTMFHSCNSDPDYN